MIKRTPIFYSGPLENIGFLIMVLTFLIVGWFSVVGATFGFFDFVSKYKFAFFFSGFALMFIAKYKSHRWLILLMGVILFGLIVYSTFF